MRWHPLFFLFAPTLLLAAPVPSELTERVKALDREDAELAVEVRAGVGDANRLELQATLGPSGMTLHWPAERLLAAAAKQAKRPGASGGKKVEGSLDHVTPETVFGYLHASDKLLEQLDQAELLNAEERGEQRVLTFKITPTLDGEAKKYVKELDIELQLTTTADWTPVAATLKTRVKGRAFMVITFGEEATEEYSFEQRDRHLFIARHHRKSQSSGTGGERMQESEVRLIAQKGTG